MKIDLHTHSSCSDGTQTPAELVAAAAAAGVTTLALTDHDSDAGWAGARAECDRLGIDFVPGVEVSCERGSMTVHLLSYLHDPGNAALHREFEAARDSRVHRAQRMVHSLATEVPITWDDVRAQVQPGATVGRPHIADALVAGGVVPNRDAAFADLLATGSRHYQAYQAPTPEQAISLVRQAGGVPVLAHGLAAKRGRVLSLADIEALVDLGLAGVEVYHRDHTAADVAALETLAARRGLIVTGSSDYHGTGKQNQLAENTTAPDMLARIRELAESEPPS